MASDAGSSGKTKWTNNHADQPASLANARYFDGNFGAFWLARECIAMRFALGLEYCGTGFYGWQSQPQGQTVQDALEFALAQIAGHQVGVICAGRTDAGVHATLQVVHLH